ncbi:hypothetical protein BG003_010889 [Podila horticola]|nr:hypothetical protein BG003_010889 [Podila horticola]
MCAEFRGHLEKMRELGLYQCWVPTRDFHTPSVPDIWTSVRFIEKCEKQRQELPEKVDKDIHRHPEVISFYSQVQEQEEDGTIVRQKWPMH